MSNPTKSLRIGIVAGEPSADILGAGLIQYLHQAHPHIIFEGIAGPRMIAAGCHPLFEADDLNMRGFVEVLKKSRKILHIRRHLMQRFLIEPPDIYIGIGAARFNLAVEKKLKQAGIPVIHYVSPKLWAWWPWQIKKIKQAVDLMLTVLPHEAKFYQRYKVPVRFVGHPLADTIPFHNPHTKVRDQLGLPQDKTIVAILPGARNQEIKYLSKLFLKTALWLQKFHKNILFVSPITSEKIRKKFTERLQRIAPQLPIQLFAGKSQAVITAADVVLLVPGIATLESMLVKRPMVVADRMSWFNYLITKLLARRPFIALPNIIANKKLVPEFLQSAVTVPHLGAAILNYINQPQLTDDLIEEFTKLHQTLRQNADQQAANAVLELCGLSVESQRGKLLDITDDLLAEVTTEKNNKPTHAKQI